MPDIAARRGPGDNGPVKRLVFVAYPGITALDLVGPHEVFAATRRLRHHDRRARRHVCDRPRGDPDRPRADDPRGPIPALAARSDRHPGRVRGQPRDGRGARRGARARDRTRRGPQPAGCVGVHRRVPARGGGGARRPARDHPLAGVRVAGAPASRDHRRQGPDLRARRRRVDIGRGDGRDGPRARTRHRGPRPRGRAARGAATRDVRAAAGRPSAIQRAARAADRRARPHRGAAGLDRRASGRRLERRAARRPRRHESAPLRTRVPRRGRRHAGRVRRDRARRGRAAAARDDQSWCRRHRPRRRLRHGRDTAPRVRPAGRREPA